MYIYAYIYVRICASIYIYIHIDRYYGLEIVVVRETFIRDTVKTKHLPSQPP